MRNDILRQRVRALKELERICLDKRDRFGFYHYLAEVFRLYQILRTEREAKRGARSIGEMFGVPADQHPIRTIIDASSRAARKTKSRWTQALRFAWHERSRWDDFEAFLRKYGGAAGCAEQWALLTRGPRWANSSFKSKLFAWRALDNKNNVLFGQPQSSSDPAR